MCGGGGLIIIYLCYVYLNFMLMFFFTLCVCITLFSAYVCSCFMLMYFFVATLKKAPPPPGFGVLEKIKKPRRAAHWPRRFPGLALRFDVILVSLQLCT